MQHEGTIENRGVTVMRQTSLPLLCWTGSRLLLFGILVAPLMMAGYLGLTVLFFLPLLGLRRAFPRRSTSSVLPWDGNAPLDSGVGNRWDALTRRARQ